MSKVCILATNGFEQSELFKPKENLENAGIETEVVSIESGEIKAWDQDDWGKTIKVDKTLDEVKSCEGYDALMIPGGQINPDLLRVDDRAVALVREFDMAGKPIAAICHAPWMLIEAGIVEGKTATCYKSIRTDLKNAGANVVDTECAQDGNLITSRNPDDIPAFSEALIARVKEKVTENA
ncbi:DJ-1/PfpI/YhbO family deglycase/protease [Erythrobacter sp. 3-20A1M]|uniref:type 1 glutamine amidotransferase domain-containing protein n=1 Tax=Erythrobacter sp. 3-20A1M TaxID=2653850 RepID=UPI001BFBFA48|nr:type 1 glutamine amidotransferase domain-containing protein [Erythrobacter sp. 3-20A1M]QWC56382.1 DJ-1/PfpI/YhbO family deglycase/protease [Erythrobacter sp. 3-20A1M]